MPSFMDAEALFDDVGPAYEQAFASQLQIDSIAWINEKMQNRKPANMLDIGSGTGKPVCSSLAAAGHDVLGVDISSVMVEHARKAVPQAKFEHINLLEFNPASSTYDAITVYFSMIAGVTQDQIREMFFKIHSWLKPGGLFVFATVMMDDNLVEVEWLGRPLIGSSLNFEQAVEGLTKAGFQIIKHEQCEFMPKAVEAGLCTEEKVWMEPHVYIYSSKAE